MLYILFFFFLFNFILVFVIVTFGHEQRIQWFIVALVNVPVEAFYWRRLMADERKHDVTDDGTTQYGKPDMKRKAKFSP